MKNEIYAEKEIVAGLIDDEGQKRASGEIVPPAGTLAALLKNPGAVVQVIRDEDALWRRTAYLVLWGLAFHALYGFVMALFGGWEASLMTLMKAPVIALSAMILCLPSLYVFSSIGGNPISIPQCFAIVGATLAMTGLMLLGMVPVTWLFSISTESIPFVVVLNTGIWLIAVIFARRFLKLAMPVKTGKIWGLQWWLFIYIIVALQMATTMRPLLTKPSDGWWVSEKKFFLANFIDSFKSPGQTVYRR
jgi:hypothetical protein